jgi:uncharacterized protein
MFEYDPDKSAANRAKHGIDFETAQQLWQDEKAIEGDTGFLAESRWLRIGKIAGKHWTAIFTERGDIIRIISARRARTIEATAYDTQDN